MRQERGAADLRGRRRAFQGLRVLRDRLQTTGWSVGKGRQYGGEGREDPEARREAARKTLAPTSDGTRDDPYGAGPAASRLGAPDVEVALERPRDATHGDLATNLALTLAKLLGQKPRAIAERLVATIALPQGLVRKTEIAGPGFINFFLETSEWWCPADDPRRGGDVRAICGWGSAARQCRICLRESDGTAACRSWPSGGIGLMPLPRCWNGPAGR